MSLWDEHIAYLKDNPEGYWFKRKLYGLGWTPASKKGWATLLLYIISVFALAFLVAPGIPSAEAETKVLLPILGATGVFIAIAWRTGQPLRWQWGPPEPNQKKSTR